MHTPARRDVRTWTTDTRRWAHYEPQPGDVVICTAAKCGTHWMKQIVSLLRSGTPEPRDIVSPNPWFDMRLLPLDGVLDTLSRQTGWRILYTHSPCDSFPRYEQVRYIHVARHGLDMFMSWHNHALITQPRFREACDRMGQEDETIARDYPQPEVDPHRFFQRWMTEGSEARLVDEFPAMHYLDVERSYWEARTAPNLLMVHFNDLKADLDQEMRRVAEFLSIEVRASTWTRLVEAATFDAMKRDAAALSPRHDNVFVGGFDAFLHKGTNARWREVLTAAEVAQFDDLARRMLPAALIRWLELGRHGAGEPSGVR